jgi:hypothetical protein
LHYSRETYRGAILGLIDHRLNNGFDQSGGWRRLAPERPRVERRRSTCQPLWKSGGRRPKC